MLAMRLVAVSGTRPLRCGMSAPRDWPCAEAGEPGWVGTTFSSQSTTSWGGGVRPATVGSARFGKTQRFREAGQDPVEGPERRRVLRRDQLPVLGGRSRVRPNPLIQTRHQGRGGLRSFRVCPGRLPVSAALTIRHGTRSQATTRVWCSAPPAQGPYRIAGRERSRPLHADRAQRSRPTLITSTMTIMSANTSLR